jgi:hypothetical protein
VLISECSENINTGIRDVKHDKFALRLIIRRSYEGLCLDSDEKNLFFGDPMNRSSETGRVELVLDPSDPD